MPKDWLNKLRGQQQGKLTVLDRTEVPEGVCELCGKDNTELRPYGRKSEWICFDCALLDKPTTEARMANVMFGAPLPDHLAPPAEKSNPKD